MRFTADSSDARGRFGFYDFGIQAMTMARRLCAAPAQAGRSPISREREKLPQLRDRAARRSRISSASALSGMTGKGGWQCYQYNLAGYQK